MVPDEPAPFDVMVAVPDDLSTVIPFAAELPATGPRSIGKILLPFGVL